MATGEASDPGGAPRSKPGNRPDAQSEFRRAYIILAVFAIFVVSALVGTRSHASSYHAQVASQIADAESAAEEYYPVAEGGAELEASLGGDAGDGGLSGLVSEEEVERVATDGGGGSGAEAAAKPAEAVQEKKKAEPAPAPSPAPAPKRSAPAKKKATKKKAPPAPAAGGGSDHLNFSLPQHICPGSPTTKGISTGGPRQNKEVIKQILEHIGDGQVPETTSDVKLIKTGKFSYEDIVCPFLTRDCANVKYRSGKQAAAKMKQSGAKWNQTAAKLPDLQEGSLGSCALIGNSDNMLKYKFGAQIDAHDTVIRHNTPVGKYAPHVGKKAEIVWVKGRYKGGGSAKASLAYLLPRDIDKLPSSFTYNGKPILIRGLGAKPLDKTKRLLYHLYGASRRKHPTGGYSRPLNIIASKLCTRVDLYGFGSRNSSGKYFKKSAKVRPAHIMSFEHWTFRYMMSRGKLCVYGE